MKYKLCVKCGQPIKPGRHKPNEYDHARGCPNDRSKKAESAAPATKPCKYGDPFCPCQDGDSCNHEVMAKSAPVPQPQPTRMARHFAKEIDDYLCTTDDVYEARLDKVVTVLLACSAQLRRPAAPLVPVQAEGALDFEAISEAIHDVWIRTKLSQGITSRKSEDGEELIVPYTKLSEAAKDLDRGSVRAVFDAIAALRSSLPATPDAEGTVEALRAELAEKDNLMAQWKIRLEKYKKELAALQAGARTGMLKFMLAGDVGCFADRMKNLLQAEDWDEMRLTVTDFFNHAHDETQKGREELEHSEARVSTLEEALRKAAADLEDSEMPLCANRARAALNSNTPAPPVQEDK